MNRKVNEETKRVYFQGKYPAVLGIPSIMKNYPGYEPIVLSSDAFENLK